MRTLAYRIETVHMKLPTLIYLTKFVLLDVNLQANTYMEFTFQDFWVFQQSHCAFINNIAPAPKHADCQQTANYLYTTLT